MLKINLLPKEYRPLPALSLPRLGITLLYIFVLFGTSVFLVGEWFALNQTTQKINEVSQNLKLYGQQYQNVKALEQQQATVQKKKQELAAIIQPFFPVDNILNEITISAPDKLWLKEVKLDSTGLVNITGNTDRMSAAALYLIDLESSPLIENTKLSTITNSTSKGLGDIYEFKLSFNVVKAGLK